MKQRILYKYVLKELLLTLMLGLAFLNSILTVNNLFSLSKKLLDFGVSAGDFLTLILLLQPQLLLFTIPIALLISILSTYGRMTMDSELIVLRSSGMSLWTISKPAFTAGMICFAVSLLISAYIGPSSTFALKQRTSEIISARLSTVIQEGVFNTTFKDIVFMPRSRTADNVYRGLFVYDGRSKEPTVVWAKEASIKPMAELGSINVILDSGMLYVTGDNSVTEIAFDKYNLFLKLDLPASVRGLHELSLAELFTQPRKSLALDVSMEINRRLSLPSVALLLMLLGPPLAPIAGKTGRLGGLSVGLIVCVSYYLLTIYLDNLVKAGKIHHLAGGWGPTAVLGICAAGAFYRMSKR